MKACIVERVLMHRHLKLRCIRMFQFYYFVHQYCTSPCGSSENMHITWRLRCCTAVHRASCCAVGCWHLARTGHNIIVVVVGMYEACGDCKGAFLSGDCAVVVSCERNG